MAAMTGPSPQFMDDRMAYWAAESPDRPGDHLRAAHVLAAMTGPSPQFMDDRLAYWAAENPDGEAITYGPRTFTWAQWDDRVRRAAGGLQALGIGRGDIVSFLDKNHPACVEISMAAGSLGAANAIVNWRSSGDEVDYAVNDCGAKVLFVGSRADADDQQDPRAAHQRRARHRGDPGGRRRRRVRGLAGRRRRPPHDRTT